MRYESRQELADKIEWEGGIDEFLLGYGFSVEDVPEDDIELEDAVVDLEQARRHYKRARDTFEALLPMPEV